MTFVAQTPSPTLCTYHFGIDNFACTAIQAICHVYQLNPPVCHAGDYYYYYFYSYFKYINPIQVTFKHSNSYMAKGHITPKEKCINYKSGCA